MPPKKITSTRAITGSNIGSSKRQRFTCNNDDANDNENEIFFDSNRPLATLPESIIHEILSFCSNAFDLGRLSMVGNKLLCSSVEIVAERIARDMILKRNNRKTYKYYYVSRTIPNAPDEWCSWFCSCCTMTIPYNSSWVERLATIQNIYCIPGVSMVIYGHSTEYNATECLQGAIDDYFDPPDDSDNDNNIGNKTDSNNKNDGDKKNTNNNNNNDLAVVVENIDLGNHGEVKVGGYHGSATAWMIKTNKNMIVKKINKCRDFLHSWCSESGSFCDMNGGYPSYFSYCKPLILNRKQILIVSGRPSILKKKQQTKNSNNKADNDVIGTTTNDNSNLDNDNKPENDKNNDKEEEDDGDKAKYCIPPLNNSTDPILTFYTYLKHYCLECGDDIEEGSSECKPCLQSMQEDSDIDQPYTTEMKTSIVTRFELLSSSINISDGSGNSSKVSRDKMGTKNNRNEKIGSKINGADIDVNNANVLGRVELAYVNNDDVELAGPTITKIECCDKDKKSDVNFYMELIEYVIEWVAYIFPPRVELQVVHDVWQGQFPTDGRKLFRKRGWRDKHGEGDYRIMIGRKDWMRNEWSEEEDEDDGDNDSDEESSGDY